MLLNVVETIWSFLKQIINNGLTPDVTFFIGLGFVALMVIFFIIKTHYSYESKLERHLEKINRWLYVHQNINENNLIEFNNLMRKAPKLLRYHWQQYILYREEAPSHYMSVYNCIEKPLHTSSYTANIKNFTMITVVSAIVVFAMSLLNYVGNGGLASGSSLSVSNITLALIAPIIMLIIGTIFVMVLRMMQNLDLASLYQNFHLFNRSIDKAVTTIPKYIDFEVLFTKKEIENGIPILGEYLEKRARQEAEELEQARLNAGKIEEYDFASSGIDGSVMLDRAMKESEIYLNARARLFSEIQQFETEINSLNKNYDNVTRDYQKKLQASKESLERLRIQQEESTNRIESNYIVKQQQSEIKKQEQLEKDQEDATTRYNQEVRVYKEEIVKRQDELAEKKNHVQSVMLSEYQTFSNKIYQTILNDIRDDTNNKLQELARQKEDVEKDLSMQKEISGIKDEVIKELKEALYNVKVETAQPAETQPVQEVQEEQVAPGQTEMMFDENPQEVQEEALQQTENVQEAEPVQEPVEEQPYETPAETATEVEENAEPAQETPAQEEQPEEAAEGYYDENGYYWFPNGTYYDDKGLYHDEYGNIYDSEGNLIAQAEVPEEENIEQPAKEVAQAETTTEESLQQAQEEQVVTEENNAEQPVGEALEEMPEDVAETPVEQNAEGLGAQEEQKEPQAATEGKIEEQKDVAEETEQQPVQEQPTPAEEKPKRKAGRPRKEKPADEEEKPKRKAGRPKKEKPAQTEEKPKRKAGRPKKEKPAEEENKPKRKAGRPKKEKPAEEENKPKRKAGRPKKSEQALNEQINAESQKLEDEERELLKTLGSTLKKLTENSDNTDNK